MTITKVDYDLIHEYVDSIIYESRGVNDAYDIIIDEIIELYRYANPIIIDEQDKNNNLKRSVLDNSKMVEKKITNELKKLMEQYDIF